jgi:hypothetical protein
MQNQVDAACSMVSLIRKGILHFGGPQALMEMRRGIDTSTLVKREFLDNTLTKDTA